MINLYLKQKGEILNNADESLLRNTPLSSILWIDADNPDTSEQLLLEEISDFKLISREEAQEIESTSKYCELKNGIIANINFYEASKNHFNIEPISFILTDKDTLISVRHTDCEVFSETARRLAIDQKGNYSSKDIFLTLIEAHIDREADVMEKIAAIISELGSNITRSGNVGKEVLKEINELQSRIITFRENLFDLQRVLFGIRRSPRFEKDIDPRLQLMLQDIDSLITHADFSFQRLDSVQDTALGLINIQQNEIMKIFSIAAVVFMPPTLVASIFGMNFKYMPELTWAYTTQSGTIIPMGYIFAISLMVLFSVLMIWFCRHKKWL